MLNEDGLTVRVLHVDSRTRVGGRAEDCEIQLPESLNLPSGAVTWCTSASVPLAWPNVSTLNNKLYVTEYVDGLGLDPFVDGFGQWQLSSATAAVLNGGGNWTRHGPNDPAAGTVMAFTPTIPYRYEDGTGRSFEITRWEETGANTELIYTNATGVETVFTWNGTRFVAGSIEWQPPPGFALQGFSQPYTWNSTGTAHNFSYVKTTSAGSETRAILFTEWTHGSDVIKFTETRAGTTPVFEYDKSLNQFIGATETWTPPANFHVVGTFPSTASAASSSQAYVVEVAAGEYNQTGLTAAVASALNTKAGTILPKAAAYAASLVGQQMSIGLLNNGAARRYNYEGLYTLAGAPRSVVRDCVMCGSLPATQST